MKKLIVFIFIFVYVADFASADLKRKEIRVSQFNIWQEGTVVEGGFQAIVDEIIRMDADLVCLSEVRNYNNKNLNERLVSALKEKGKSYYSEKSRDSGILSKYPVVQQWDFLPVKDDRGSITKALIKIDGVEVALYRAHLDYRNCSLYLQRGYDGSTWKELPAPVTDSSLIAADNMCSRRDEAIDAFISDGRKEKEYGRIVILGGDFNEPSHLDWTEATKELFDHHGVVMEWRNTKELEKEGYVDVYREWFPHPVTHPGFTFPADNPLVPLEELVWSPKADDRDRIDFIFYHPNDRLNLIDVNLVGPKGSVAYNRRVRENSSDPFDTPAGVWPSDHKVVLAVFRLKTDTCH